MILPSNPQHAPISEGLNTGLSGLLTGLAEGKAKQMHTKNLAGALHGLGNITPEQAVSIAQLPENLQKEVFSQMFGTGASSRTQAANKPFREQTRKGGEAAERVIPTIDKALDLVDKVQAVGPVLGRLPAVSSEAQELDALLNELLLEKSAFQSLGNRGTNLYLKLQQAAKPSRSMNKPALKGRLNDIRKELGELQKDFSIEGQIIDASNGREPADLSRYVMNVKKISELLPEPSEYPEGTVGEEKGYQFELRNGQWIFVGKSK